MTKRLLSLPLASCNDDAELYDSNTYFYRQVVCLMDNTLHEIINHESTIDVQKNQMIASSKLRVCCDYDNSFVTVCVSSSRQISISM